MQKRFWPATLLVCWLMSLAFVTPIQAADESTLEMTTRVGQMARQPRTPGDALPSSGDDDMPDRTVRPHNPTPVTPTAVVEREPEQSGWLWSLRVWWIELRSHRFAPRF